MSRKNNPRSTARQAFVLTSLSVALLSAGVCTTVWAAPTGGNVAAGNAAIAASGLTTTINQTTNKAVINWTNFSISADELVKFMQPNANSVILNRVTGNERSDILGQLQANGRVFLVNPNGIVFGSGARIDVAGLLATTLDVDDNAFMNGGDLSFHSTSSNLAKIVNQGQITVGENGFLYLVAPSVENSGTITANLASVTLAAGNKFLVNLQGGDLINFSVSADALTTAADDSNRTGVNNTGTITAQHVLLSGNETSALMSSVVNNTGVVQAQTLDIQSADIVQGGTVDVTDTASLTATNSIATPAGSTRAHVLNLAVTADGASIGAEGAALQVDADILNATATNGHVIVTDTAGGVALGQVTTGTNDNVNQRRAIITSLGGDITSADSSGPNVTAWSANFVASGAIGSAGQALTTDVNILSASTANGGIAIHDLGGQVVLGAITANEAIAANGQTISSGAISSADGSVTLSNGAAGTKNISIETTGDLFLSDAVSTGNALNLTSDTGNIYSSSDSAVLTGKTVSLSAGKAIGVDGGAIKLQSETLNAAAQDGGVFASESNGLTVGTVTASAGNDVAISVGQGGLKLGSIDAAGGAVSLATTSGAITDNNGSLRNVNAASLAINSSGAVGTSADGIETSVGSLQATVGDALAGLFVANDRALSGLSATTTNGDVKIGYAGGQLAFSHASSQLTVSGSNPMDLAFDNQGGDIVVVNGLDVGSQNTVSLTSFGSLTQSGAGVIAAKAVTLDAGKDVGSANTAVQTRTAQLDANSDTGIINVNDASTGALNVTASAQGANGAVTLGHAGDLVVGSINATNNVSLNAVGQLLAGDSGGATTVTAGSLQLTGTVVGSAQTPFATVVTGPVSIASSGDINYSNAGSLSLFNATTSGNINFNNQGDVVVGSVQAGNAIAFNIAGAATDGNGGDANFGANSLAGSATSFGTAGDALETRIGSLTIITTGGGIYASNLGSQALALVNATSGGSDGDISIANEGNIALGVVNAGGADVTLKSGGSIEDARPAGTADANVTARTLNVSADGGIGQNGDLALDVTQLSASGGSGGVKASNAGAIAVDSSTLEGKGASGVSITASDITLLDNGGGTITMDAGGNLVLTATTGSIVFLNQGDTIYLPGGGSITLTALGKSDLDGYNGAIVAGNLKTDGGAIKLEAQSNITIGMLDASTTGDVSVIARNGVILDGNGSLENIRGNHVVLEAHTPSQRDAELTEETAIADYAAKQAELNAKEFDLQVLIQQLQSYEGLVQSATLQAQLAATAAKLQASLVAAQSAKVDSAQSVLDGLNTALKAATVVRNAAAFVAGAAQAVPFSGDAGADAAFAAVDVALSIADLALDTYERYTFDPLSGTLADMNNQLDQAQAALTTAMTNLHTTTTIRDTVKTSEQMAELAVFKATVAYDASTQLRKQAVAAYDLNKDIDSSADKPLGISANQLDVTGSGAGGALNTSLYLNTQSNLGLGNITVASGEQIAATAGQNISVVGTVHSDTAINLNAGAAILGAGGTLVTPTLTAVAGEGIGTNQAINTQVSTLAATGGNGGVNIVNRTGALLTISELGAVKGVSGAGNITLDTDGDLNAGQLIEDSSGTHTVTLNSGGAVVDGNGGDRNVQGGELVINAAKAVSLDTEVEGLTATLGGTGDLDIRDASDLAAYQVAVNDGKVDIQAGGNLVVGSLAANTTNGAISLTAGGRIDDDQDTTTDISGDSLTLKAGGSIGANGDMLTTRVNRLDGSAGDAIQIADADDLQVGSLKTTQGDVFVASRAGSLNVGTIATRTDGEDGNTITLVAGNRIDNGLDDETSNLTAANLNLGAGSGIGAGHGLNVEADRLEAAGGSGGIALTDLTGDLRIDTVAASGGAQARRPPTALNGLSASGGDIHVVVKQGALDVEKAVTNTGGAIALNADGAIQLNSDVTGQAAVAVNAGGDVTQNANIQTAGGDVTVGSTSGSVTMAAGTATQAGTGNVAYTAGGDMQLRTIAGNGVTLGAGGAIQLDGDVTGQAAIAVNAGGNVTQNADLLATGDVTVDSTTGGITMAAGTSTQAGTGNVSYIAGGDMQLRTIAGNGVTLSANGAIQLDGDVTGQVAIAVNAGGNVTQNANILTANGNVTVGSQTGDIAMADGTTTAVSGAGDVAYDAGGNVRVNTIDAHDGNVQLQAQSGSIEGSGMAAYHVAAKGLTAIAATGVGTLDQAFDTRVGSLAVQVTQGGTINVAEADALQLTHATNANGLAQVTAGGDIAAGDVQSVAGTVALVSTGSVNTAADGLIQAKELKIDAHDGVAVHTRVDHASIAVLGQGDLNVDETGSTTLDQLSTAGGNINVAAAGGINVQHVSASEGNGDVSLSTGGAITSAAGGTDPAIVADRLALNAGTGIGNGDFGALRLDVNRLQASTAAGNANLDQDKAIAVDSLAASQGSVNLLVRQGDVSLGAIEAGGAATLNAAGGALRDDGDNSTRVVADSATLAAAGDIDVQTRVNGLSAIAGGNVNVDEADGLASLNVQSAAGDVSVRSASGDIVVDAIQAAGHTVSLQAADGAIRNAAVDVASVTSDRLVVDAAHGVGSPDNAMDVSIQDLSAQGGTGGVYINNLSGSELALNDAGNGQSVSANGDIVVTTAGNLRIASTVANTGNGRIVLQSGGDIAQDGDVTAAGNGNVSLIGAGSIDMGQQAKTTSHGDILYQAGDRLALSQLRTGNGVGGGRVTLVAPTIVDNLPGVANVQAGIIDMDSRASSADLIRDLVGDDNGAASVNLDARPYAGTFTKSQRFMTELSQLVSRPYFGGYSVNTVLPRFGSWVKSGLIKDARSETSK